MKYFMIKYRLSNGTAEDWHKDIAAFIAQLDSDADLKGRISYRCMKEKDGTSYIHIAGAADETAIKALQGKEFFKRYTEKTKSVAGGEVVVSPLEIIAETVWR